MTHSRSDQRSIRAAEKERAKVHARHSRSRDARIRRQVSQRRHWSVYVGVTMLALGVVALVVAAIITR
ncbi:hypothetical protein LQ938_02635 [Microbacterium sp. cx-55]|uniref:hypothetical protein n=1 Tax=unclassified Microbacterium TaxID=2609290 RepID=UPI001CC05B6A|nr:MULTISPECIES: hypothetical protein [unclassified Microbacterium]MBZ4487704.1 hypothetical protein [Microbacterium sp. cx-55]MCC4908145.1 hypothetical protein [Microbacterium sp. cx-59]UGB35715.1 hypothetical protein LQ938_02635 [Microbacterium sp. cx-55]